MDEPPPTFDKGREPAPVENLSSYEERMAMSSGSGMAMSGGPQFG